MRARLRGIVPLLLLAVVVLLTVFGLARGLWLENVHNAALAVTFTSVGAYVLFERPRHREGALFLATVAILPWATRDLTETSAMLITSAGLLIVVGVVLDTMKQLEAQLLMRHYEGFIK